jgi:hypothetical protein
MNPHNKLSPEKVKLPPGSGKGAYDDAESIARRRVMAERY